MMVVLMCVSVCYWFLLVTNSSSVLWKFFGFGSVGTLHVKYWLSVLCSYGDVGWRKFLNR